MLRSGYDKDRYQRLIERAVLRYEFWKGTTEEQVSGRAVAVTGGRFRRCGPTTAWAQVAANDRVEFAVAQPQVWRASQSFSWEWLAVPSNIDYYPFTTSMGVGGVEIRWRGDVGILYVTTYTAAGLLARQWWCGPFTQGYWGKPTHFLYTSIADAANALCWVNGNPVVLGSAGPGGSADGGVSPHYASGIGGGRESSLLIRSYPMAVDQADANAIWGAASVLSGEG